MNYLATIQKKIIQTFSILSLSLFTATALLGQTPIAHNISTGSLVIPGYPNTSDYIITQTNSAVAVNNTITVEAGYVGTIILQGVNITSSGTQAIPKSCIHILGEYNRSNLNPYTKVNIVLDGDNKLTYTSGSSGCAFQVDQGAQIHINAANRNDNTSGKLEATNTGSGSAAIGAPYNNSGNSVTQGVSEITCTTGSASRTNTSGGNVIIGSGTVTAKASAHGAGIGGGWYSYYNGVIIVYGGVVTATTGTHAAAIGSGCPQGSGVNKCSGDVSTIVALPPATISAVGADGSLAGARNITYLNDPNKSLITVRTEDYEPNANIYLDLTENNDLVNIFSVLGIDYDLSKVRVGRTDATGLFSFKGELQQYTTFFTDASSSKLETLGRPYLPFRTKVTTPTNIVLELLKTNISFTDYPSTPLEVGYTTEQAKTNAFRVKVEYNDPIRMTEVTFALQGGINSNFIDLQFYRDLAGTIPITDPITEFNAGDIFYIVVQIKQGRPLGIYEDVMLIGGTYGGTPLPGYIRRVGMQRVVKDDSGENKHIKVTADPKKFTKAYPTSEVVTLTLNIDHTDMFDIVYDPMDVIAKYLVTTIADYDLALAASPLNGPDWLPLNIPAANGVNRTTTVDFSGKPIGTYYIHWYVESGVAYAHSLTVTDPVDDYGGFGPYIIFPTKVTLSLDKLSLDEGGGAATGTATLKAKLEGANLAPTNISINLTYGGTATHGTGNDYTAPTNITILEGHNDAAISFVALSDYLVEELETITIAAPPTVAVGGFTYDIISSSLSNITIVDKTDGTVSVSPVQNAAEPNTKGQVTFKFSGTGATAVTCTYPVKVVYSYSGASATNNYTPKNPTEVIIQPGQNSVTVDDVLTPIDNYVVEGVREVTVTITGVTRYMP